MERINDFKEREAMEICIPGADSPDSVLTHKDGRVRVMQEITGEVRNFGDGLPGNVGVPLRRGEDIEPG